MASEVDISNLALGHLGDVANLQSISPPDGSAQADHCQRFLPIARDSLLEMHDWSFATRRTALAQLSTNPSSSWAYAYSTPANMINAVSVLDPAAADDTSVPVQAPNAWLETPLVNVGVYTPQPFTIETATDGTEILLTNMLNAVLRHTFRQTDTTRFSPLFVDTLSWYLASMLAGPVIKGKPGVAMAQACLMTAFGRDGKSGVFGRAIASDAGNKKSATRDKHYVPWLNGR